MVPLAASMEGPHMLIISRRPGESFFIGDNIEVVILEAGSHVRVGINAPRDIEILRTELIPPEEFELAES